MSGGSHNYIANEINVALFEDCICTHYRNVCDAKNARIARNLNPMYDRELSELMADVTCLLYGLEWYESSDISYDEYKECANKFKKKWLPRSTEAKANSYAEDLKALYKELDAELREE